MQLIKQQDTACEPLYNVDSTWKSAKAPKADEVEHRELVNL